MPDFGRWTDGGGDPSLNEINRVDRFIDALSTTRPVYSTDPAEAELAFLLSDWRDDVRDAPITAPVTERDAVDALHGGHSSGRRSRTSLALVGSVAAAVMCVGGFGAAVYGSGPGDSLYGMRSSLFGTSQATRDDQVSLASAQLQQVQQLIDQGQWQQAQDKLVEVSSAVQNVDGVENKQDLAAQWNALTYKVVEQNPAATLPPGEPLPVLPSSPLTWLPVPVVEATTSETTSSSGVSSSETSTSETSPSDTTSSGTTTSGSTVTSAPTDTSAPSEAVLTPPPESSTVPSTSLPSTPVPATTLTSAPPAVSTTVPPSTVTTTTTVAPAATTTTRPVQPPPASAESPAASAPRVAPSSPKPPPPVSEPAAASPPVVASQPKAPTTTTAPQEAQGGASSQSGEGASGGVVTTTIMPPR